MSDFGQLTQGKPQKTRSARVTKATVAAAIKGSRGVKSVIAARLGCARNTVYNYLDRWPDLQTLLDDESEALVDTAEVMLASAVASGDIRAITFTLATKGKARGYSQRTEITGADGGALVIAPDVLAAMGRLGLETSDVVREFEALIRAKAGQSRA